MSFRELLLLCVLLQAGTSRCSASEENYLYSGCRQTNNVRNIFDDSLSIMMKYPPEEGFVITVHQPEGGKQHSLNYRGVGASAQKQEWLTLELISKGKLELRFPNGTTWLTEEGYFGELHVIPEKTVRVQKGYILPDCPQELPNWKVQRNVGPVEVLIDDEDEEIFSFMATTETKMTFDIGDETLTLCWSALTNSTVVVPLSAQATACTDFPSLTVLWIKIVYKSQMVHISDPFSPFMVLRSFHMEGNNRQIIFRDDAVDGAVYVVHHLKGLHESQQNMPVQEQASAKDPVDICMMVSVPAGIVITLILITFILLTALFYNRWMNARQVLLLLQRSDANSRRNSSEERRIRNENDRKPSLPSHPPPPCNKIATDNQYLTPLEFRKLKTGEDARVKSEHIYEDMTDFLEVSMKGKTSDEALSKENIGFDEHGVNSNK